MNIVLIWKSYRTCTSQRRTKNVKCIHCCQMFALFYSNFARWLVFVILKSLYSCFILLNIFFILISIHYDNLNVFLDKIQYFQHHMSFCLLRARKTIRTDHEFTFIRRDNEHILIDCINVADVHQTFYNVNTLSDSFTMSQTTQC